MNKEKIKLIYADLNCCMLFNIIHAILVGIVLDKDFTFYFKYEQYFHIIRTSSQMLEQVSAAIAINNIQQFKYVVIMTILILLLTIINLYFSVLSLCKNVEMLFSYHKKDCFQLIFIIILLLISLIMEFVLFKWFILFVYIIIIVNIIYKFNIE